MRAVLVDWLVEVHSQFKLLQETLYMTVYVIDKFLQVSFSPSFPPLLVIPRVSVERRLHHPP